eukprot:5323866-Prymnesium_polylepis.1
MGSHGRVTWGHMVPHGRVTWASLTLDGEDDDVDHAALAVGLHLGRRDHLLADAAQQPLRATRTARRGGGGAHQAEEVGRIKRRRRGASSGGGEAHERRHTRIMRTPR